VNRREALHELLGRLSDWWRGSSPGWLGRGGHERHQRGWRAEDYAANRLIRDGYHILGRNVRVGPGEIDIVAEEDRMLVFIEVRSREEGSLRRPLDTITWAKRKRVRRCGVDYVRRRRIGRVRCRFDVVEVFLDGNGQPARAEVHRAALGVMETR